MAINFDTHEFIKALEAGGYTAQQAETLSDAFKKAQEQLEPVTKDYLDARLLDLENRLVKWGIGLALGQAALIAALIKLL